MTNYMIFLRSDRSQHLRGTGPNRTGPNPSAGPVPTPKWDQSQPLNMIFLRRERSQHLSGTGPN